MLERILMAAGVILYHLGLSRVVIGLGKQNPKVLLFHDIAATESPFVAGLGTTMHPDIFAGHLEYLSRHYEVTSIDNLLSGPAGRPRVAIAFDDGYRSVFDNAFPVLRRFGMPAIVYLITRVVGNRAVVWVNELNYLLLRGGDQAMAIAREEFRLPADAAVPDVISAARVSFDRDKLESLIGRLQGLVDEPPLGVLDRTPLYLDWQSIHAMAEQGITFGNHTATHPNMGRLTEAEQRAEITEAQQVLQNEGLDTKHFAYPFGHHNDATARLANESGLHWIAEVGGDNHGQRSNHVGRVDIRAMTQAQLFAQIEVVEPVKSLLRRILSRPKAGWCPQPSKPTFESLPITSR